jgi:hypothetical protein
MTGPSMAFVEELGIDAVQLPHTNGKIAIRSLDEKMVVVGHEAVGVTDPVISFVDVLESVEEIQAILFVLEDGFLLVAPGGDMIDSTRIFYAQRTGHGRTIT